MKFLYRVISCLLIIPILSLTSGCASYRFGRLPSPYIIDQPNSITQKDVSVAVKFMSVSEAFTTFDCEMDRRNISPVFIVIENKSSNNYGFRKADIDSSYISGEQAAKKCARSTMGRVATYGILGLIVIAWVVFIPMAIGEMINCPRINSQMRADYTSNEIADATIGPGRSLSGVMYVAPFKSRTTFTIPLINRDTNERLLFQFQYNQPAPVNIQTTKAEKENKEKKEPKKNFGP
jgi:hypothetical protein